MFSLLTLCLLSTQSAALPQAPVAPQPNCVSPIQRARIDAEINAYMARTGGGMQTAAGLALFEFFPLAGNVWGDLAMVSYMDHIIGAGSWQDWHLSSPPWTFDGHTGTDVVFHDFDHQDLGMPVFSIEDGTVVGTLDGQFDRNTVHTNNPYANYVIIDYGGGYCVLYNHLRNGSITVSPGNVVSAGQQIAEAGSSGASVWPHLHLEVLQANFPVGPFAGLGNPTTSTSMWAQQPTIPQAHDSIYSILTNGDPLVNFGMPNPIPRAGAFDFTDTILGYSHSGINLPANPDYRLQLIRPNGSTEYDSGIQPFMIHPVLAANTYLHTQTIDIPVQAPGIHAITGTWTFRIDISGMILEHPFEVLAALPADYNRAPEPIAVSLDPPAPDASSVIACRVESAEMRDADFDVLKYHYVWTVDGVNVRDVTTGAQADFLERGLASTGQSVQCAVTVSDDSATLPAKVAGALIGGGMKLEAPAPGIAGQMNTLAVSGAAANQAVHFIYGFQLGVTPAPGCANLSSPIQGPTHFATRVSDANGLANLTRPVPPAAAGVMIYLQVFDVQNCMASNLMGIRF